jgi:hypothetical protein
LERRARRRTDGFFRTKRFFRSLVDMLRHAAPRSEPRSNAQAWPKYGVDAVCCNCVYFRWASQEQLDKVRQHPGAGGVPQSRGNCRRYPPVFVPLLWKSVAPSTEESGQYGPGSGLFADMSLPIFTWPIVWSRAFCGEFKSGQPTQAREQDRPAGH